MPQENKPICIIGAGPAGLTAAYQLAKAGKKVIILEASDKVGGMSASFDLWGQKVDLGPHRFFSKDKKINQFWLEALDNQYNSIQRLTRIYFRKKYFHYPLQAWNAFFTLGPIESFLCLSSYIKQKISPEKDSKTFESWVIRRFGKRLYQHFFKSYTEKLWGIPCHALDEDFAAQRIKKLSLSEAVRNAFGFISKQKHATLVDIFAYPKQGAGEVYEKLFEKLKALQVEIRLNCPVEKILSENHSVIGVQLKNEEQIFCEHVISSMPLTLAVKSLAIAPEHVIHATQELKFRNTVLVYLQINKTDLFEDQWMYIHEPALDVGRITNFSNWKLERPKQSILCLEFWCNQTDKKWSESEDYWFEKAEKEIILMDLIKKEDILAKKLVKIPKCYPIYANHYKEHLNIVVDFLKTVKNLSCIGRYGSFKYNNQDHSILMGLLVAENLIENKNHNLWTINTDYDVYQEDSEILTKE